MDKLIEFFTTKNGPLVFITLIAGFFMPGTLFIFGFNRDLFFELDIVRLLILAGAIAFSVFIIVFVFENTFNMLKEKYQDKKIGISDMVFKPIMLSDTCIYVGIYFRINEYIHSMKEFVNWLLLFLLVLSIVSIAIWGLYIFYLKIKNNHLLGKKLSSNGSVDPQETNDEV